MIYIYTQSGCTYCKVAKEYLEVRGLPYTVMPLENSIIKKNFLESYPHLTTVPQIFQEDVHIGDYQQLVQAINDGRLS